MLAGEVQQLLYHARTGVVHPLANQHLYGFQIHVARLAKLPENHRQQPPYFPANFLLDDFRRFFSCADSVSSTGRARQIVSLVSTKARLSS